MRYLFLGILYIAVYLGAGALLGGHPTARTVVADMLLLGLGASVCLVVLRRRRDWEGTQRIFWDAFAAGMALWCVGQIGFTITAVTEQRSWLQWHTMFSLCGGIGPAVAMIARPYLGPRRTVAWAVAVDLVNYAMLFGFVYACFIMVPSVVAASGPPPQATLLALVQFLRFVLCAGFTWCLWRSRHTNWRTTFGWLAAGTAVGFFLRIMTSDAISSGRYHEGSLYDLAWIVPFGCYVRAALDAPPSSGDPDPSPDRGGWQSAFVSAAPVFLIPIIGIALLRVQPIGDAGDSVRLLLTTLATVAGLGVLTLRLSMQQGELQRADARVRMMAAATEQTAELILITRADGAVEHANDACVHALGYTRDELATLTLRDLLDPAWDRTVDHVAAEVRQKGTWRGTLVRRRKDGGTFPVSSTVVPLRNRDGRVTHFVGVERDITEELSLRDQLVHSERLSAVGEVVAGVAHEINNPLQTIMGCVELMIQERRGEAEQPDLEVMRKEAARAGQIVRNLLAFVRRSSPDRSVVDLNEIARAVAHLRHEPLARRRIAIHLDLDPGVLSVCVGRDDIQQAVLNLVLNAADAIAPHPGTVTIRTRAGAHAHVLEVADDGPGIPLELRGRVFEPFFTTKEVGEGTGLGLSIALGIARAHGGSLELRATTKGACFELRIPAGPVAALSRSAGETPDVPPSPANHDAGRRGLVVDDETPIRIR